MEAAMTSATEAFNALLFALLLALPLLEARWNWPRYVRKVSAGIPGARLRHFRNLIFWEWTLTLAFLASWKLSGKPWSSMLVNHVSPIQTGIFLVYAGLMVLVFFRQRRAILSRPATIERLLKRLDYARPLLPQSPTERRVFWFVSATAGICEETLYRGFLTWYLARGLANLPGSWAVQWLRGSSGIWVAIALSSLIFGVGHVYLGAKQVPRTFLIAMVLASLAYFSGSLWPSIVLHAAIDWNSGELGFALLNRPPNIAPEPASDGSA